MGGGENRWDCAGGVWPDQGGVVKGRGGWSDSRGWSGLLRAAAVVRDRKAKSMDAGGDKLLVRQFERVQCRVDAEVEVAPESGGQVRLARSVGDGSGRVKAVMTDCSGGGLGLRCPVFFPKHGVMLVRVMDGAGVVLFEGKVRVQRAVMASREPMYDLGGAFVEGAAGVAGRLGKLIDFAKTQGSGAGSESAAVEVRRA